MSTSTIPSTPLRPPPLSSHITPSDLTSQISDVLSLSDSFLSDFSSLDEITTLRDLRVLVNEMGTLMNAKESDMRQVILSIKKECDGQKNKNILLSEILSEKTKEINAKNEQKLHVENNIQNITKQISQRESNITQKEKQREELNNTLMENQRESEKKFPQQMSTLGLYKGATGITWDGKEMGGKGGEGRTVGHFAIDLSHDISMNNSDISQSKIVTFDYVECSHKNPIGSFTVDGIKVKSKSDISNELWEILWKETMEQREAEVV